MTYASKIDGAWRELLPSFPFRNADIQASWETVTAWSDAERKAVGILPVPEPDVAPEGKVDLSRVLGGTATPEWVVTYADVPAPSLDEIKANLGLAVDAKRDAVFAAGFTPAAGPLAGHTLQTRDSDDKVNWLTSQAAYSAAVMGGQAGAMGATFRTADNATFVMSFADGLSVLLGMAAWGSAVFGRSWALKDAIAAADETALAAIDVEAGWPA